MCSYAHLQNSKSQTMSFNEKYFSPHLGQNSTLENYSWEAFVCLLDKPYTGKHWADVMQTSQYNC